MSRAREGAREGGRGREIAREAAVFSQPNLRKKSDVEGKKRMEEASLMDGKRKERKSICELKIYRRDVNFFLFI